MSDREEFERRLLALVRDFMDESDEYAPGGYDIEDFIVVYQVRYSQAENASLKPWHGGPRPGWWLGVAFSSTTGSHWHDESLLTEALERVRNTRFDSRHDDDGDEEEDEAGA